MQHASHHRGDSRIERITLGERLLIGFTSPMVLNFKDKTHSNQEKSKRKNNFYTGGGGGKRMFLALTVWAVWGTRAYRSVLASEMPVSFLKRWCYLINIFIYNFRIYIV